MYVCIPGSINHGLSSSIFREVGFMVHLIKIILTFYIFSIIKTYLWEALLKYSVRIYLLFSMYVLRPPTPFL